MRVLAAGVRKVYLLLNILLSSLLLVWNSIGRRRMLRRWLWLQVDVVAGHLTCAFGDGDANDGAVDDGGVGEEDGFEFGGGNLPAADFYEVLGFSVSNGRLMEDLGIAPCSPEGVLCDFSPLCPVRMAIEERACLCAIDNIYFPFVNISNISRPQPAILIDSRRSSSRVIKVAVHHTRAFDVHLAMHIILIDCITIQILQPIDTRKHRTNIFNRKIREPYFILIPGKILPKLPVSSASGQKNTIHRPVSVMPKTCVTFASGANSA
jgi:hypothetical protein